MVAINILLTDQELTTRLRNFEDPFVERKVASDAKDYLKTAIAFANSLPDGVPGVMFVPCKNDGAIQEPQNLDELQKTISAKLASAYPPLQYFQHILNVGAQQVLAVTVWGSPMRPHFAGPAYVRDGSQTKVSSEGQFALLIARRNSKVEELARWHNKIITAEFITGAPVGPRLEQSCTVTLTEYNQWYITIVYKERGQRGIERESIVLERISISFDHTNARLLIEIGR